MTEANQTKIFMLVAAPFILLANWLFAAMASHFAWWSWAEPVIFYGLGARGRSALSWQSSWCYSRRRAHSNDARVARWHIAGRAARLAPFAWGLGCSSLYFCC
jgi:hypothetical protein